MKNWILAAFCFLAVTPAWAGYQSVMDTGEILPSGHYRAIFEPDLLLSRVTGAEVSGKIDVPLNDSMNFRALVGGGDVDFETGAFLKWIPYPDTDRQPALGFAVGATMARYNGLMETSIRLNPLISKKINSDVGWWTPYASLPLGIATTSQGTTIPVALAIGTQFQTVNWKNLQFMAELGINLHESYSYIAGGVLFYFDGTHGFTLN